MAALSDFIPLVGQHCPNAPSVSIEFWARRAAIEFCRRTLAHQATLASFDTVIDPLADTYTLAPGTGLQVAKLLGCRVNGQRMELRTPAEFDKVWDLDATPSTPEYVYLSGTNALTLYPPPATVLPVVVRVALEPTATAATVDDIVFSQYADAIAYRAAAHLAMTPDGRDERLAAAMMGLFEAEIGKASAATYFNRSRSGPRTTPTWC
jgi:hypothetical protein